MAFFLMTSQAISQNNLPTLNQSERENFIKQCGKQVFAILRSDPVLLDINYNSSQGEFYFEKENEVIDKSNWLQRLGQYGSRRSSDHGKQHKFEDSYYFNLQDTEQNKLFGLSSKGASVRTKISLKYETSFGASGGWAEPKVTKKWVLFECIFLEVPKGTFPEPNIIFEYVNDDLFRHVKHKRESNGCGGDIDFYRWGFPDTVMIPDKDGYSRNIEQWINAQGDIPRGFKSGNYLEKDTYGQRCHTYYYAFDAFSIKPRESYMKMDKIRKD